MNYVPLHTHSEFSLLSGVPTIHEFVMHAKKLGLKSLALTDKNNMSGLILFYQACLEQNIHPILGVELSEIKFPAETVVLLAKNGEGYGDICELISRRQMSPDDFSFSKVFAKFWPNLFILTSSLSHLQTLKQTPNRGNLFAEIILHSPETRQHSKDLAALAQKENIPLVASGNSYFLHPQDFPLHRILRAIDLNSTLSRLKPHEYASCEAYLQTPQQMEILFSDYREAIGNTEHIANACQIKLNLGKWIMPEIPVPQGYTPDSYLKELAEKGLLANYAHTPDLAKARNIQDTELQVISQLGYASYFLMVKEVREWANEHLRSKYRRPNDCTILRGSAANSITFYNLGVSDLDPIRYDLYFQRFLNEDRASPPDADLDFGWDEREKILQYVVNRFGRDHVAITCTTNHFRYRAAFREVAKVHGYSEEQITKIIKSQQTQNQKIGDDEIKRISAWAKKIEGKPHFLGQHPGGVLITNQPIWRHIACEWSGGEKNRLITQVDMHNGIDELGLIKFDLLGNGSLSVLRDTLAQLEKQNMPDPQVWDLEKCYADVSVQDIIRKGRTRGIFYIESPAQIRLNKKAQAETFDEITITSSLVRPAASDYTQLFVERHRKLKMQIRDWDFVHPSLKPILKDTHDICAFQEDVTKICHQVAGLSFKKADKIRKMMNSQHEGMPTSLELANLEKEFIAGCCQTNGLTLAQAQIVWQRVSSFTGFSFCKSHSASYAQLSFRCTFLKAHYPAQFLSAVISNNHGFYTREVYLDEARRWGLKILPLDINQSQYKFFGQDNWIRPGFMHLPHLGETAMLTIEMERKAHGLFHSLMNFLERITLPKQTIENFILAGAFNNLGHSQPELLYQLDGYVPREKSEQPNLLSEHPFLMAAINSQRTPRLQDYSLLRKCLNEWELLGYMLSGNMLDILELHPSARNTVPANQIHLHVGKRIKVFGLPITERLHEVVKSGRNMKFITLEDKTECLDVIFWPNVLEKYNDVLLQRGPLEIWGKVSMDWDTYTLEADKVNLAVWSPNEVDFELSSKKLQAAKHLPIYANIKTAQVA